MTAHFESVDDVRDRLAEAGYLASDAIATTVFLADALGKPLLVEGPAGVGKTELAKAVAAALSGATGTDADLVRLQCYEGIDEARALYEWNHAKQLLRITANTALAQASSSGAAASTSTTNSAADAQPDASSPAWAASRPASQPGSSSRTTSKPRGFSMSFSAKASTVAEATV